MWFLPQGGCRYVSNWATPSDFVFSVIATSCGGFRKICQDLDIPYYRDIGDVGLLDCFLTKEADRDIPFSRVSKLTETALPAMQVSTNVRITFRCFCIRIKFSVHFILQKYNCLITKNELRNTIFVR